MPDTAELTFTSGNWNGAQTVTVTGVDDPDIDGNIGYTIVLDPASTVLGRVLDTFGEPVADVAVQANAPDGDRIPRMLAGSLGSLLAWAHIGDMHGSFGNELMRGRRGCDSESSATPALFPGRGGRT